MNTIKIKKTKKQKTYYEGKTPPCNKYEGLHIQYSRNNKQYCRKKTRFAKEKEKTMKKDKKIKPVKILKNNETIDEKKNKKINVEKQFDKCTNIPEKELSIYAQILNIDYKDRTKKEICEKIQEIFDLEQNENQTTKSDKNTDNKDKNITIKDIVKVCQLLNISIPKEQKDINKNIYILLENICEKILNYASPNFKNMLNKFIGIDIKCSYISGYVITKIITHILHPSNFPHTSPKTITIHLHNELTNLKDNNTLNNSDEQYLLQQEEQMKICHKLKEILLNNKFVKEVINENVKNINITKEENINKCQFYNWYEKLNYINNINI